MKQIRKEMKKAHFYDTNKKFSSLVLKILTFPEFPFEDGLVSYGKEERMKKTFNISEILSGKNLIIR